jgi:hypothetical protein
MFILYLLKKEYGAFAPGNPARNKAKIVLPIQVKSPAITKSAVTSGFEGNRTIRSRKKASSN